MQRFYFGPVLRIQANQHVAVPDDLAALVQALNVGENLGFQAWVPVELPPGASMTAAESAVAWRPVSADLLEAMYSDACSQLAPALRHLERQPNLDFKLSLGLIGPF